MGAKSTFTEHAGVVEVSVIVHYWPVHALSHVDQTLMPDCLESPELITCPTSLDCHMALVVSHQHVTTGHRAVSRQQADADRYSGIGRHLEPITNRCCVQL